MRPTGLNFLNQTAAFRRIDLHWCLTLEPSKAKAFERKPQENAIDTSRMLSDLEKTATILQSHLGSSLGLRLLDKTETFQFFSYLFNLEEWAERDQLRSDTGVDRQIVKSPVAWHSDHVTVGKRHVQMFSLKTTPEASRPCLFSGLLTLDCDSVLCSTWRVKSTAAARKEIDSQEKFISFFKVGVLTRVMSGRDTASLETGAGAKAANINVDDLSEVIRGLDKKAQGEFSLRLLLAARSQEQLRYVVPAVHRIFVDARAQVMEETLGKPFGLLRYVPRQSQVQRLTRSGCRRIITRGCPPSSRPVSGIHTRTIWIRNTSTSSKRAHSDPVLSGRLCGWRSRHAHHRANGLR